MSHRTAAPDRDALLDAAAQGDAAAREALVTLDMDRAARDKVAREITQRQAEQRAAVKERQTETEQEATRSEVHGLTHAVVPEAARRVDIALAALVAALAGLDNARRRLYGLTQEARHRRRLHEDIILHRLDLARAPHTVKDKTVADLYTPTREEG